MKALLVSPKSPRSFWTFDASVRLHGKKSVVIPLGLITVAALLPETWELKIVDREFDEITEDHWSWSDVVLLTGMIAHRDDMLAVISEAGMRGTPIVVGGPYASLLPTQLADAGADFVMVGEGESSIPLWLEALEAGVERGIFHEREKPDLTRSPPPRFDLLDLAAYAMAAVQTTRGCPFGCEFCDIASLYGSKPRHKSPDQFIDELSRLHESGWEGLVMVSDDNFIGSRKRAKNMLEALLPWMKNNGQPFDFWTQTSVNLGHDEELIDLMTAANFGYVFLGIENPDEKILEKANKRHNFAKPLEGAIRTINARGLSIVGSFIMGFDGEQAGTGERIKTFVEKMDLPIAMFNALQAVPGTPLWNRLRNEGRLIEGEAGSLLTGATMNFTTTRPREEILEELRRVSLDLYEPSGFIERAHRYYLGMRPTRKALLKGKATEDYELTSPVRKKRTNVPAWVEFLISVKFLWTHGVSAHYRFLFWKTVWSLYRRNPSRLGTFLNCLGIGRNLFELRSVISKRFATSDGLESKNDAETRSRNARLFPPAGVSRYPK